MPDPAGSSGLQVQQYCTGHQFGNICVQRQHSNPPNRYRAIFLSSSDNIGLQFWGLYPGSSCDVTLQVSNRAGPSIVTALSNHCTSNLSSFLWNPVILLCSADQWQPNPKFTGLEHQAFLDFGSYIRILFWFQYANRERFLWQLWYRKKFPSARNKSSS